MPTPDLPRTAPYLKADLEPGFCYTLEGEPKATTHSRPNGSSYELVMMTREGRHLLSRVTVDAQITVRTDGRTVRARERIDVLRAQMVIAASQHR